MRIKDFSIKDTLTATDILDIIKLVGKNKDLIIVKNDGIRENDQYSVIIISSNNPEKSFRCDNDSLQEAMKNVLKEYVMNI
ncbi:hypothetical protein FAM09_26770 [Niastella caeni]|uniref:Uncharacterized protein n=1 Tax=Niastella caeni TaxID=2569763 RepID=A0A4S8HE52_9BACT|nr:hypothetical protein [Niastella caeni]THU32399.1 hypothetical protein FAM09_26770 [Niastella caeni]